MCLNPIYFTNPTNYVSLWQAQRMKLQVKCNKCAECLSTIRSEWLFRSYYHSKATLIKGGYIMMDTLTYRPADVPRLSDFVDVKKYGIANYMCFNFKHVRDFLKNLRIRLKRLGYGNNCFTYFITSEYGTSELGTHRPHYHILLFVNNSKINPYHLSALIGHLWIYGRTDGILYHPKLYVSNHIYGYNGNDDIQAICAVTNYVSKYVTKDSTYQNTIDKRLQTLKGRISVDEYTTLFRHISMFHRQSQGFGLDYLNIISSAEYEDMINTTEMQMPDSHKLHLRIKLPMYYIRKLYYIQGTQKIYTSNIFKDKEHTKIRKYWYLSEYGKEWRKRYLRDQINKTANNIYNQYLNMNESDKDTFSKLLDGRDIKEYTTYLLLYKDRLVNGNYRNGIDAMLNFIVDYDTPLIDENRMYRYKVKYPYLATNDIVTDKCLDAMVSYCNEEYANNFQHKHYRNELAGYEIHQLGNYQDTAKYFKDKLFTEHTLPEFRNFDKLFKFMNYVNTKQKSHVQLTFDKVEELKQHYKSIKERR